MAIARAERHRPCFYMDHLWIDWDLSMAHCMEWYDPSLRLLPQDFLAVSLDEIVRPGQTAGTAAGASKRGSIGPTASTGMKSSSPPGPASRFNRRHKP